MPEVQPSELEEAVSALMIGADSSSAALLDYVPPKVSPCANTTAAEGGPIPNCGNEANLSCGKCHLVRVSHWIPVMSSSHVSSADLVPSCCLTEIGLAKVHTTSSKSLTVHQYCSKDCQVSHWPIHKLDCKSDLAKDSWQPAWVREHRNPAFVGNGPDLQTFGHLNYLWGNIPAIDVLNVGKNEGEMYGGDLDILFAGQ